MKLSLTITSILALLSSCTSNREVDRLKSELAQLNSENTKMQVQIEQFENSIIIKPDEIHKYLMTLTCGGFEFKRNEETSFETYLVFKDLPENIQYEWRSEPEVMSIQNDGIPHYLKNTYETIGLREFFGSYVLTFPDGHTEELIWKREFEVK